MDVTPKCTLITGCYDTSKFNNHALSPSEMMKKMDSLLKMPVYLVIFTDNEFQSIILESRIKYGFEDLTHIIVQPLDSLWSFSYLKKVKQNRELYWPTRDLRTSSESHLITCNKFDFVLTAMNLNIFNTPKFAWIDAFIGINSSKICEDYTQDKIVDVLNNITDKFHIQILNVCDKKYKNPKLYNEYYRHYRYVVCGSFFSCGKEIGIKILNRLKEIMIETTELGYGHGEEMFYLQVLDEYYDDIEKGYGDYGQIINNILYPMKNLHYVYNYIVKKYANYGYYRECYDCCRKFLFSIEQLHTPIQNEVYLHILFHYLISSYYYKKEESIQILNKIYTTIETKDEMKHLYNKYKETYNEIIQKVNALKPNYDLIFCVFGCPTVEAYKKQILKINETWGRDVPNFSNVKLLFFFGEEKTDLLDENKYIYLNGVKNDYMSASYKQNLGLKYINDNFNYKYVFICGTDTFVNVPKLVNYIPTINSDKLYIGGGGENRMIQNKNYFFQSGAGFILTKTCIDYLHPILNNMVEMWLETCNNSKVKHLFPACDVAIAYYLQKDNFIQNENILIDSETFLLHNFRGMCNYANNSKPFVNKNENDVDKTKIISCHFMNLTDFDDFYKIICENNYFIRKESLEDVNKKYILNKYNSLCEKKSNINEHLPTFFKYASNCESVLETGVKDGISNWAFLSGLMQNTNNNKQKRLFLNDTSLCYIDELLLLSKKTDVKVEYKWINNLDLEFEKNETFDIVFIDSWHVYGQLKRELDKFSKITNKYIMLHDTEVDAIYGETIRMRLNAIEQSKQSGFSIDEINCGLNKAVYNFLYANKNWRMLKHYTNNNGLTILEKLS